MSKQDLKSQVREGILSYPKKEHVESVALFGSQAEETARPGSDIDLLVTFKPDAPIGLFEFARMVNHLEKKTGRKVDMVTPGGLSPHFRDKVISGAEKIYG